MTLPKLIAHRGYAARYPENSLIGIQAAIDAGARYIEIDIQLSADLEPVLFHDRTMERLCRQKGAVHDYDMEQLSQFRVTEFDKFGYRFAKNPIATLDEFTALLEKNSHVKTFVELKRISLEHFGSATVVSRVLRPLKKVASQCTIISYSTDALAVVRNNGWTQVAAVIDHWNQRNRSRIRRLQPQVLFCNIEGLPRRGKIAIPNTKIAVFETVDPKQAMTLTKRGVDFVETFAIAEMLSAVHELSRKP